MSDEKSCRNCGKPLPADAPEGVCPSCLAAAHFRSSLGRSERGEPLSVDEVAGFFPELEILCLLGAGGMGAVYKARQPNLDRLVALKVLHGAGRDAGFVERFVREAKTLARLSHPNVVAVYDFGHRSLQARRAPDGPGAPSESAGGPQATPEAPEDALFFLVMELVDGVTLRDLLTQGRVPPEQALTIVPPICDALQYAHEKGVVHRDIKPENVLIDKEGRVKVADFGIARLAGPASVEALTGEGQVMGTPHYMAPEQVERPGEVDHRADIYALGVVFYEMLTGELPLGKFAQPSSRVQIDVRLDEVVLKALEKEPSRRYQQASEVRTSVQTIAGSGPAPAFPGRPGGPAGKHRTGLLIGAGAAALLVVVAVLFNLLLSRGEDPDALAREGWLLWNEQRLEEAAAKFSRALELDPENAETWNGLGWASFNSGNREEAGDAFRNALALDPEHPAALNGLGQIFLAEGEFEEAEKYLVAASPRASAAWFGLARLYLIRGDYEEAERWAQNLVDSGESDRLTEQMLAAAREKSLPEGLRLRIQPQDTTDARAGEAAPDSAQDEETAGEDPHAGAKEGALAAATAWLERMDAGRYGEAWDESAPVFRASITRQQWEHMAGYARQPLGGNLSRSAIHQTYTTSVPGAPDGEYVVIQFRSEFEHKQQAIETITPMLDRDGVWRVSGYFVQ